MERKKKTISLSLSLSLRLKIYTKQICILETFHLKKMILFRQKSVLTKSLLPPPSFVLLRKHNFAPKRLKGKHYVNPACEKPSKSLKYGGFYLGSTDRKAICFSIHLWCLVWKAKYAKYARLYSVLLIEFTDKSLVRSSESVRSRDVGERAYTYAPGVGLGSVGLILLQWCNTIFCHEKGGK